MLTIIIIIHKQIIMSQMNSRAYVSLESHFSLRLRCVTSQ